MSNEEASLTKERKCNEVLARNIVINEKGRTAAIISSYASDIYGSQHWSLFVFQYLIYLWGFGCCHKTTTLWERIKHGK